MTKEDICNSSKYIEHRKQIRKMLKIPLFQKRSILVDTDEEYNNFYANCINPNYFNNIIPIITTSAKTGKNIERLHDIFKILIPRHANINIVNIPKAIKNVSILSYIECVYQVRGVGIVITGTLGPNCTAITVGADLFMGPFGTEKPTMIPIKVKGLHGNFRNSVKSIESGQSFCANIRFLKNNLSKNQIRKGLIITSDPSIVSKMGMKFIAKIKIINLKTTVGVGYNAMVHFRTIRQTARIIEVNVIVDQPELLNDIKSDLHIDPIDPIDDNNIIRGEREVYVKFEFLQRAEYIEQDAPLFFRDGITKGVGKIITICD
jgi:GTPase